MALYVYDCDKCPVEVEQVRSWGAMDKRRKHVDCGGTLKRVRFPGCNFNASVLVELREGKRGGEKGAS